MAITLGSLTVGDKVKFGRIYGVPIVWRVADKNHEGYPGNSVTLVSDQLIKLLCFDAKEPQNNDSVRKEKGNNRYLYSNIRQWLNSEAGPGEWYTPQHSADAPPSAGNVWNEVNPYSEEAGFLHGFTDDERSVLLNTTVTVGKSHTDGGGTESCTDRMFLLSCTEAGVTGSYVCGSKLEIFTDDASRIATVTPECAINCNDYGNVKANEKRNYWLRDAYANLSGSSYEIKTDGTPSWSVAYDGYYGLRPACNLSSDLLIPDSTDSDGCYNLSFNQTPACPAGISVPSSARAGESISVSWTACTDPDGDTVTYKLRRDSGFGYVEIYSGPDLEYRDTIPPNSRYVQYQVCAYDGELSSPYATSSKVSVLMDLNGVILWGGSGKELTRTLPNPATGFKATVEERGIVLSCDGPSEVSGAYLKDYWVVYKKVSEGEIEHPYDGEHLIFEGLPPVSGQKLSALEIGSRVKIRENGVLTNFLVVQHGYPTLGVDAGQDNTLLLRRDIYDTRVWNSGNNAYVSSSIHTFLNEEYLSLIEESIRSMIPLISLPYTVGNGNNTVSYIDVKAFLLSHTELGYPSHNDANMEGTAIEYFNGNDRRVARYNGETARWWLRSARKNSNNVAWNVHSDGIWDFNGVTTVMGLRPAFCLPGDTLVSLEVDAEGCYTILV